MQLWIPLDSTDDDSARLPDAHDARPRRAPPHAASSHDFDYPVKDKVKEESIYLYILIYITKTVKAVRYPAYLYYGIIFGGRTRSGGAGVGEFAVDVLAVGAARRLVRIPCEREQMDLADELGVDGARLVRITPLASTPGRLKGPIGPKLDPLDASPLGLACE